MKKTLLFVTLVLVGLSLTVLADNTENKSFNHKKIEEFMGLYYDAFNNYGQSASTIDVMDQYWANEFVAIFYFPGTEYPVMNLTTWKDWIIGSHAEIEEILTCQELSIDTKNMTVVSRFKADFYSRLNGELILSADAIGFYSLQVDKKHDIKISCIKFYAADPYTLIKLFFPQH